MCARRQQRRQASPAALSQSTFGTSAALGFLELSGLLAAPLGIVLEHEADLVSFVERWDPGRFERPGMNEDVPVPVLWLDEAKSLAVLKNLTVPLVRMLRFPSRKA